MTKSYHPSKKKEEKPYPRFTWLLDAKQVITDIAHGEADLDTPKSGCQSYPCGKNYKSSQSRKSDRKRWKDRV